jgi:hypothetical protein
MRLVKGIKKLIFGIQRGSDFEVLGELEDTNLVIESETKLTETPKLEDLGGGQITSGVITAEKLMANTGYSTDKAMSHMKDHIQEVNGNGFWNSYKKLYGSGNLEKAMFMWDNSAGAFKCKTGNNRWRAIRKAEHHARKR